MATPSGRFFGFAIGGTLPAALAADWLTAACDQNTAVAMVAAAEAAVEAVTARWLLDLCGLPATASVGFVTGGAAANFTCLAAARHRVLGSVGWDVEADGPPSENRCAARRADVQVRVLCRLTARLRPDDEDPPHRASEITLHRLTELTGVCGPQERR